MKGVLYTKTDHQYPYALFGIGALACLSFLLHDIAAGFGGHAVESGRLCAAALLFAAFAAFYLAARPARCIFFVVEDELIVYRHVLLGFYWQSTYKITDSRVYFKVPRTEISLGSPLKVTGGCICLANRGKHHTIFSNKRHGEECQKLLTFLLQYIPPISVGFDAPAASPQQESPQP